MAANDKELRDSWETPDDFWAAVNKYAGYFAPCVDVCASRENAKCTHYLTEKEDALKVDWVDWASRLQVPAYFWCNPGYSNLLPWVLKASETAEKGGIVYLLTHDNYNSVWFRAICSSVYVSTTMLLQPRIHFKPAAGIQESSPRGNNMLHIFMPSRAKVKVGGHVIVPVNWKAFLEEGT